MQAISDFTTFVGIDVSRDRLDVHVLPESLSFSVPNTSPGARRLLGMLSDHADVLVVLEAPGGLQDDVAQFLAAAGLSVAVINPRQIRDFARALGLLAKTDRIDAWAIARFAEAVRPRPRVRLDPEGSALAALTARRRQLVAMISAEGNRLKRVRHAAITRRLRAHLRWLGNELKAINAALDEAIEAHPAWRETRRLMRSVPGVGAVTSATLIAALPELGHLDRRRLASLVGVAPFNRDSGLMRGKRTTWGGRAEVRAALYMAALVASSHNPVIAAYYDRLIENGKPPKLALTACMRKLLTMLNAIVRDGKPWSEAQKNA